MSLLNIPNMIYFSTKSPYLVVMSIAISLLLLTGFTDNNQVLPIFATASGSSGDSGSGSGSGSFDNSTGTIVSDTSEGPGFFQFGSPGGYGDSGSSDNTTGTTPPPPTNSTTPPPPTNSTSQPIIINGSCNNFNFQNQNNSGNNAAGQQGSSNEADQDISQVQANIQNACTTIQEIENRIIKNYISNPAVQQQISQVPGNGLVRLDTIQICSQLGDQACIDSNNNFKILFSQVIQDSLGNWVLNGEVQNVGNQPHDMVTTTFYLYDAQGNIIGLNQGNTMPVNLNSMQAGLFNVPITNSNLINPPHFYRVSYAFGT